MLQEIIVYIILIVAAGFAVRALVKRFGRKSSPCDGCSGCDLKNTVRKGQKPSCGCS
ncbi:FeoB-associated Cys-rich membrane protein [Paludibacter sp.]|uniref:FeoB-associated Cys-rich membrane protein n=1 Tax=Paludibacter sp. TaxID=1898105 RepID=UPI0013557FBE|nr:FeoB-associated Cys-rich membrane protein [Paludibacter sp.]MTK54084.1 FeoB-associated Cys-rich membrane protein [Paludibacter sp.]